MQVQEFSVTLSKRFFLQFFCTCQPFNIVKHKEAVNTAISSEWYVFAAKSS